MTDRANASAIGSASDPHDLERAAAAEVALYSYESPDGWSLPLPLDRLSARRAAGLLSGAEKVQLVSDPQLAHGRVDTILPKAPPALGAGRSIGTGAEVSKLLGEGARHLSQFHEAAAKTSELANDLTAMNKALATAAALGKASAALGALGAGLGLADTLVNIGKPSDTELILNAIRSVEGKVDDLRNLMLEQFTHLEQVGEQNTALVQVTPHCDTLSALSDMLQRYARQPQTLDREMVKYNTTNIHAAVYGIVDSARGAGTHKALFSTIREATYGDLRRVMDVGNALYALCLNGVIADALIRALQMRRDGRDDEEAFAQAQIENDAVFGGMLEDFTGIWSANKSRCEEHAIDYMQRKCESQWIPRLSGTNHDGDSKSLHDELRRQWFWYDWLAIVYAPVGGFANHGFRCMGVQSRRFAAMWKRVQARGAKVNIFLAWARADLAAKGASHATTVKNVPVASPLIGGRFSGPAEDNLFWRDLSSISNYLVQPLPAGGWAVWGCRRHQGLSATWSNDRRVKFANGKFITVAIWS